MAKTPEEMLTEANTRLKAGRTGVAIAAKRNTLYLRAKLPPKPNSSKADWSHQWLALGAVRFTVAGIKRAEAEALRLSAAIALQQFRWPDWLPKASPTVKAKGVADWVADYERDYFNRRQRNPKSETTWEKDYAVPYRRLVQVAAGRALTEQVLLDAIATYAPDSRSRQRACGAYQRLASAAGLDVTLKDYRGHYSPKAVNVRELPSDEAIVEAIAAIKNERWRYCMALMATYGLRDHEVFYVDLATLDEPPGVCTVLDGKTGWRQVWPYPGKWWEHFNLKAAKVPALTARRNSDYGVKVAQYFKRHSMPFLPYDLRHAWAARTAVAGLDPAIAARMMGHALTVHTTCYHQFISRASMQQAWERSQG